MAAPSAMALRDGEAVRLPTADLVPGDAVLLEAGAIVPADLRLIEAASLRIDEAALTGESLPVDKSTAGIESDEVPVAERRNIAHKGTLAGAKALAGTLIDLFTTPADLSRAKETFRAEIGGVKYRPLLPPDQKPPVALNRDLMEQYRPAMRAHYVKQRPKFV